MKIVYLAHPIAGDVKSNLEKIIAAVRHINLTLPNVVPFVPYYADCIALQDAQPQERARGMTNNFALFNRGAFDELWALTRDVSQGMRAEINLANKLRIPVYYFINGKLSLI